MEQTRPETVTLARSLRRQMSPPEARLWNALRRGGLEGLKFRRQHPFGRCVLDFYCPALRLAVEVDGACHTLDREPERDAARDRWLNIQGVRTLRIPAHEVMDSVDSALGAIRTFIAEARRAPPPPASPVPLPQTGEER
ncbi:endonuclease domain-containing protein [uncultured Caulobacter sp.]|uniref:endonuclease domain-containing protein n=1 Tax=uncultured Caulobacter sp. TaxID=158749 RepID=UPI002632C44D|nr:endonuclease domain-containing protein [uncultured Caulobacter sp.]